MAQSSPRGTVLGSARTGFAIIVAIIVVSYGLFFYLETSAEFQIRAIQFENNAREQLVLAEALADGTGMALQAPMAKLQVMAVETDEARLELISKVHASPGNTVLLDGQGVVAWASPDAPWQQGADLSGYGWAAQTESGLAPVFAGEIMPETGEYVLVLTLPVIQGGTYAGQLVEFVPAESITGYVQPRLDESQILQIVDRDAVYVVHPDPAMVKQSFHSEEGQAAVESSEELNGLVERVVEQQAARSGSAVYRVEGEELFTVAASVPVGGATAYYMLVTSPATLFSDDINAVLATQRIQAFSILAGTSVSVIILAVFVNRTVSLDREVRRRTSELEASNRTVTQQKAELERANEELKKLDNMKDEFLNVAAHELRTPITPILMAADALGESLGKRPDVRMLVRNAKKLEQLVQNVLDLARIDNNSFTLSREQVNLGELVYSIVEDFNGQMDDGRGKKIAYETVDVQVDVDRVRVTQVLSNILNNAIKFTKEGQITVAVEKDASSAVVSVRDSGKGIDAEIMPKLFQKFATKSEGGTGLGLYISKNIVEAHGGRIWAENNPSGGATFYFSLPLR
ncbi:ATP-binding protein [Candidatus Nitrososphaera sp. FF02]|uniref:sensor histidine kinase n=1 Tax=Candidatus Nitrososphaera sp. FF02 TaxID=3398226 RepID=UPI0039EB863C